MAQVLVVDDEAPICWGLKTLGESLGHQVSTAASAEQALAWAEAQTPDAVFLDVRLPGIDGLAAIEPLRALTGPVPIVVMTAFGDLETAVRAVEAQAFELLVKPFDLNRAQQVLERALAQPVAAGPSAGKPETGLVPTARLVGRSPAMRELFREIALVSRSDACVQLWGESGTGKERVARAIHQHSARASRPFVAVNLAAINPSLVESELFGHVAGAFTGAASARVGLIELADGGTLLLDEVADTPPDFQAKLLRVLDHGEYLPVGASQPRRANLRVISATHQDLAEQVALGRFRHDLYYRLSTFRLRLPSLRERAGDAVLLAEHFAAEVAARNGLAAVRLSREALAELERRPWYGNVRELRSAVEHALVLARSGQIQPEHLPAPLPGSMAVGSLAPGCLAPGPAPAESLGQVVAAWARQQLATQPDTSDLWARLVQEVEGPLLEEVLSRQQGNLAAAARQLGLHRVTVARKAQQHGLRGEEPAG